MTSPTSDSLPPISALPTFPTTTQTHALDLLFEPSPTIHALLLPLLSSQKFPSYDAFISAVHERLTTLAASSKPEDATQLFAILSSHPRLGEKKVDSAQSRAEQKNLRGEGESEHVVEDLRRLNVEYEGKFGGLRYVVFVNGRSRPAIMENMRTRIARGDIEAERKEAIQAMCDIARDRASKLQKAEASL